MLTAAKIIETVPWIDAKYYAATQTMDEARHTEVFQRYLSEKVGDAYPMSPYLQGQVFGLLEDYRWDIAYLGMQIIIESLALAAFGEMLRRTDEPLLRKLLRYVLADEARHVAFGILSLQEFYENLSEPELKERQEFLAENTLRSRPARPRPEMWERLGVDVNEVLPYLIEAAAQSASTRRRNFQRAFFSKLVPNVAQARPARCQRRLPAPPLGRGRPAAVRVRRRHRIRLRAVRRRRPGPRRASPPSTDTTIGVSVTLGSDPNADRDHVSAW